MNQTVEKLRTEALSLPNPERVELVRFLLQTLDQEQDIDAEAAWDAELARRAAEIESGQGAGKPAEQVFAEIRKKYR